MAVRRKTSGEAVTAAPSGKKGRRCGLLEFRQDFEHLVVRHEAARVGDTRVNHHPVFIDDEPGTLGTQITGDARRIIDRGSVVVQHAVGTRDLPAGIAQQRILQAELFAPRLVGVIKINTDAQDLGICGFELGKIQLESQRFLRSSVGESADIEKQHRMFLAGKISQLDFLAGA